jgi:hypothetical protein
MARTEAAGTPIGAMDAFIAATAEVHGMTLVTRNTSDFETFLERIINPWAEDHASDSSSPSQSNVAHWHGYAPRLDIDVTMRGCLHSGNERLPCEIAFEAAKLFRGDDDHFVTPVHRHVLRSFTADASAPVRESALWHPARANGRAAGWHVFGAGTSIPSWRFHFPVLVILTKLYICGEFFKASSSDPRSPEAKLSTFREGQRILSSFCHLEFCKRGRKPVT